MAYHKGRREEGIAMKCVSQSVQKRMEQQLQEIARSGQVPRLLLHSCCAPCSSAVIEMLSPVFLLTVFYDNPNITDGKEYTLRKREQQRLIAQMATPRPVAFVEGAYDPRRFFDIVQGGEADPEGGARCQRCYAMRLRAAAQYAQAHGFDYFATTLSISPKKRAEAINAIGFTLQKTYGVAYLEADFKKKGGFDRSLALSRQYGLYRQDYCGCALSRARALTKKEL